MCQGWQCMLLVCPTETVRFVALLLNDALLHAACLLLHCLAPEYHFLPFLLFFFLFLLSEHTVGSWRTRLIKEAETVVRTGGDYRDVNDNEFKAMDDRRARSEKRKMETEVETGSEKRWQVQGIQWCSGWHRKHHRSCRHHNWKDKSKVGLNSLICPGTNITNGVNRYRGINSTFPSRKLQQAL